MLAAGSGGRRGGRSGLSLLSWARQGPSEVSVNYLAFQGSLKFNGSRFPLLSVDPTLELGGAGKAGVGSRFLAPCGVTKRPCLPRAGGLTVPMSEVPDTRG